MATVYRDVVLDNVNTTGRVTIPTKMADSEPIKERGSIIYDPRDTACIWVSDGKEWHRICSATSDNCPVEIGTGANANSIYQNVAVGCNSLASGTSSVAVGGGAALASAAQALGTGAVALGSNTSANSTNSIAIGFNAEATGISSIAIGISAKTVRDNNIVVGNSASLNSTAGDRIIAIGSNALSTISTGGDDNIAIGHDSMSTGTITGDSNVTLGNQTLRAITAADRNVAIGHQAGRVLTDAQNMTLVGYRAGYAGTALCTDSTLIGAFCGVTPTQFIETTAIGHSITLPNTAIDCTAIGQGIRVIGNESVAIGARAQVGTQGISIGRYANYSTIVNATSTGIAIGISALRDRFTGNNIGIGANALRGNNSVSSTGADNVIIGNQDGGATATTAQNNVCIGSNCASDLTTGSNNVFIGYRMGEDISTGSSNVLIGGSDGTAITVGTSGMTAIGYASHRILDNNNQLVLACGTANPPTTYLRTEFNVVNSAQTGTHYLVVTLNGTEYGILLYQLP